MVRSGPPGAMDRIAALENRVQAYAWGSRTALAELQGRPSPTPSPEAELWMGAHPRAPSAVVLPDGRVTLDAWIERHPAEILGADVAERFGGLPFLFKVIAAEKPLSIQAHPDAAQARAGFARENARGVPLGAPHRSYPDASHKPEIACALTRFVALRGFRPKGAAVRALAALGVADLAALGERLAGATPEEGLRALLVALLEGDAAWRARVVRAAADAAARRAGGDPVCAWIARLHEHFPGDVGILAPVFLNLVELEPGEAMFLPAGELHAYLEGVAVELMANSDNVLRGGLTPKHVDVPELLHVLRFRETRVERLLPDASGEYETPAGEFRLARIDVREGAPALRTGRRSVEILLCTEGSVRVVRADDEAVLPLARGASCVVPAAAGAYRLEGAGTAYRASVPV